MAAAVDTTAVAVPQVLAGLSPASAPAAAAAAAAAGTAHSLLCVFLKCAVFVVLIYAVRGFFTKPQVSHTEPYRFLCMP